MRRVPDGALALNVTKKDSFLCVENGTWPNKCSPPISFILAIMSSLSLSLPQPTSLSPFNHLMFSKYPEFLQSYIYFFSRSVSSHSVPALFTGLSSTLLTPPLLFPLRPFLFVKNTFRYFTPLDKINRPLNAICGREETRQIPSRLN